MTTKNSAGVYTLKCTADTQGLGPVSYEWKEYGRKEGNWTKGDHLMVKTSKTCEEFSCRLITLLRTSEASDPMLNPLCEPGMCQVDGSNVKGHITRLKTATRLHL